MEHCGLKYNIETKSFFEAEILKIDGEILRLNLSKPALRAMIRLKVYSFLDLREISQETLKNAHGLGPATLNKLNCYLKESMPNSH
jgi:hypothetical protein